MQRRCGHLEVCPAKTTKTRLDNKWADIGLFDKLGIAVLIYHLVHLHDSLVGCGPDSSGWHSLLGDACCVAVHMHEDFMHEDVMHEDLSMLLLSARSMLLPGT